MNSFSLVSQCPAQQMCTEQLREPGEPVMHRTPDRKQEMCLAPPRSAGDSWSGRRTGQQGCIPLQGASERSPEPHPDASEHRTELWDENVVLHGRYSGKQRLAFQMKVVEMYS